MRPVPPKRIRPSCVQKACREGFSATTNIHTTIEAAPAIAPTSGGSLRVTPTIIPVKAKAAENAGSHFKGTHLIEHRTTVETIPTDSPTIAPSITDHKRKRARRAVVLASAFSGSGDSYGFTVCIDETWIAPHGKNRLADELLIRPSQYIITTPFSAAYRSAATPSA